MEKEGKKKKTTKYHDVLFLQTELQTNLNLFINKSICNI
jgi:hypothetical protein